MSHPTTIVKYGENINMKHFTESPDHPNQTIAETFLAGHASPTALAGWKMREVASGSRNPLTQKAAALGIYPGTLAQIIRIVDAAPSWTAGMILSRVTGQSFSTLVPSASPVKTLPITPLAKQAAPAATPAKLTKSQAQEIYAGLISSGDSMAAGRFYDLHRRLLLAATSSGYDERKNADGTITILE